MGARGQNSSLTALSGGRHINTGNGPTFQLLDIGHDEYVTLIDPDSAFWMLVKKEKLPEIISDKSFLDTYLEKSKEFINEMNVLRFELEPSAVYFNPTQRCNLNCSYCYIPEDMRRNGIHMTKNKMMKSLEMLKNYFTKTIQMGRKAQIIFHGSEPLLNKDALFEAIEAYKETFDFGIQTNATLLTKEDIDYLVSRNISIGISLDGHEKKVADKTRHTWNGDSVFSKVISVMDNLRGYQNYSVITTVTTENMYTLTEIVDFFHKYEVPTCMLNMVRCTQKSSRSIKPMDSEVAKMFINALERTHELYQKTGRKLVVANFANILISIIAPTARRLMCDISPCGAGRSFFAIAANGDIFPCSEFIGIEEFKGGNLFKDTIADALQSKPFKKVITRKVENISPCSKCAIRHFCGAPCPAEAYMLNGEINTTGAFCGFYEEQVRYAFRLIADGKEDDFIWDEWDAGTKETYNIDMI